MNRRAGRDHMPHRGVVALLALLVAAWACDVNGQTSGAMYIITERRDGFGAQLQGKLACMLYALHTPQVFYVHTPYDHLKHLLHEDRNKYENLTNLGAGELQVSRHPPLYRSLRWYNPLTLTL